MKKKGLIVLLLIFVLMLVLNTFTPLLSDEYFTAFVWPQRVRINDVSFEAIRRLSGFEDIFSGLRGYYYTWGGRVPGGFPVYPTPSGAFSRPGSFGRKRLNPESPLPGQIPSFPVPVVPRGYHPAYRKHNRRAPTRPDRKSAG